MSLKVSHALSRRQIFLSSGSILISELSNLALNKPASQSSTAANGVASLAVDGNHNSNYYYENGSCTHTACGSGPGLWWMVDLERTAIVYEIKITNRNKFGMF